MWRALSHRLLLLHLGTLVMLMVFACGLDERRSRAAGNAHSPKGFSEAPVYYDSKTAERVARRQSRLVFESNVGQVRGGVKERVKFIARRSGFVVFLLPDEIVLKLGNRNSKFETRNTKFELPLPSSDSRFPSPDSRNPAVLRLKFMTANQHAEMTGIEELSGKSNYFVGSDPARWWRGIPTYARVQAVDVYPGIDLIYYGREGRLEYDIVVHPGADPGVIRLSLEMGSSKIETRDSKFESRNWEIENGKSKIENSSNGDLLIPTGMGKLRLNEPIVYQRDARRGERSFVRCRWKVTGAEKQTSTGQRPWSQERLSSSIQNSPFPNSESRTPNPHHYLAFDLGPYDRTKDLIIDPVLSYSTYLGGSGYDAANAIAVDSAGDVYITGKTDSLDFPTSNSAQAALGTGTCGAGLDVYPCFDAFVTKLSATGSSVIYSTYLGGTGDDRGTGIAVDSAGNAYVTGITNSADFPLRNSLQSNLSGGNCDSLTSPFTCYDAFVAKLGASGSSIVYSTYLGGTGQDVAAGIAVDSAGEATVAGSTSSLDFPVSAVAPQGSYAGGTLDAFVTRLDPSGAKIVYSTYLGGSGEDRGLGVAVNAGGDTVVVGSTTSTDFPLVRGFQNASAESTCGSSVSPTPCTHAFITRLNSLGTEITYSTYLGGTGSDIANAVAMDNSGGVLVTGSTTSTDFPTTQGSFQRIGGGVSVDVFVSRLSSDGSALEYSTYLGGIGEEAASGIAVDSDGNAYITGYVNDAGFPLVNPVQPKSGGFNDAFVSKLNATGSGLVFSTYLGGSGDESGQGIAVDADGNAYVTGWTFSSDFPTLSGFEPSYPGGSYAGFVVKLSGLGPHGASLSKTSVSFAEQRVSTASTAQIVTLSSVGTNTLTLSSISTNGDFAQTNNCGDQLPAGASCEIDVVFLPTSTGARAGLLTVLDDAPGSPHTVSLSGVGVAADFAINAANPVATISAGQAATFTLAVTSVNGFSQPIAMECSGNPPLSTCQATPTSVTPSEAAPATVTVKVTTTAPSFTWTRLNRPREFFQIPAWCRICPALFAVVFLWVIYRSRRFLPRRPLTWLSAELLVIALWTGCSGWQNSRLEQPGTPAGLYTLKVSGASGQIVHTTELTLQVNQAN